MGTIYVVCFHKELSPVTPASLAKPLSLHAFLWQESLGTVGYFCTAQGGQLVTDEDERSPSWQVLISKKMEEILVHGGEEASLFISC